MTVSSPLGLPLPDDTTRFLSSLTFEALLRANQASARSRQGPAASTRSGQGQLATRPLSEVPKPSIGVDLVDGTPEEALRTFTLAMAAKDERVLRAITLPDDGFEWLLKDRPASLTGESLRKMKERLDQTRIQRLKAGDRVKMPGGRTGVIRSADVRNGRVVLRPTQALTPRCWRTSRVTGKCSRDRSSLRDRLRRPNIGILRKALASMNCNVGPPSNERTRSQVTSSVGGKGTLGLMVAYAFHGYRKAIRFFLDGLALYIAEVPHGTEMRTLRGCSRPRRLLPSSRL